MSDQHTTTFQNVLDGIESLPDYQQENLIDIVQHRLTEQRRDAIAENIRIARKEYAEKKVRTGSVNDLMKEITR